MDPAATASGAAPSLQDTVGATGADPGNHQRVLPDVLAAVADLDRGRRLAGGGTGDLFQLFHQTQQGAGAAGTGDDGEIAAGPVPAGTWKAVNYKGNMRIGESVHKSVLR